MVVQIDLKRTDVTDKECITFNEAIEKAGHGRFQYFVLLISGLCLLGISSESISSGFISPFARGELKFTLELQGLLNSATFAGIVVTAYVWGFLADTWGRLRVLKTATSMSFVCTLASSFSTNVWTLIGLRFLCGAFVSGLAATSYAYLGEFHSDRHRSRAIALAAMFNAVTMLQIPAICWLVMPMEWQLNIFGWMHYMPWRLCMVLCGIVNLIAWIGLCVLPESPKFLLAKGRQREANESIRFVYRWNNGLSSIYDDQHIKMDNIGINLTAVKDTREMFKLLWSQTIPIFRTPYLLNTMRTCLIAFGVFIISTGFVTWVPYIIMELLNAKDDGKTICQILSVSARENMNGSVTETVDMSSVSPIVDTFSYKVMLCMGVVFCGSFLALGMFINRVDKKWIMGIWILEGALSVFAVLWITNFYVIVVLLVTAISCGSSGSILSAISVDLFHTNIRAMALCFILMAGRMGAMFGTYLIGVLIENYCETLFMFIGGMLFVASLTTFTLKLNK